MWALDHRFSIPMTCISYYTVPIPFVTSVRQVVKATAMRWMIGRRRTIRIDGHSCLEEECGTAFENRDCDTPNCKNLLNSSHLISPAPERPIFDVILSENVSCRLLRTGD